MSNVDADRALALVGTPFRAQGREPRTGLDCAGVAICAFAQPPEQFRRDYRLRGNHRDALHAALQAHFRRVPRSQCRGGDLMLLRVAADQLHLAIRTPVGFVHADAGIGHVVETPGIPRWPLLAVYRRRKRPIRRH